jgi:hypothetical protein
MYSIVPIDRLMAEAIDYLATKSEFCRDAR